MLDDSPLLTRTDSFEFVRISLNRCERIASSSGNSFFDRISHQTARTASKAFATHLSQRVFAPTRQTSIAETSRDTAQPIAPSHAVALQRCTSAPVGKSHSFDVDPIVGSRSVPTGPRPTADAVASIDGGGMERKRSSPVRPGILFLCKVCKVATSGELELNQDGEYVHARCGVVIERRFVAGDGHEKRSRIEDDPGDALARADSRSGSSAPWYGTLKQKQTAALAGGLNGTGTRRTGLALVHAIATKDAIRNKHENILTSRQATRLRSVMEKISELLDDQSSADVELVKESKMLAENVFAQASRSKRVDEVVAVNASLLASALIKMATEKRLADDLRHKSPVFQKARFQLVHSVPEAAHAPRIHLESVTMLLENLLGVSKHDVRRSARPDSRASSSTASKAVTPQAAALTTNTDSEEDSFF